MQSFTAEVFEEYAANEFYRTQRDKYILTSQSKKQEGELSGVVVYLQTASSQ